MTPDEEAARLNLTAAEIERITGDAFDELLRRIAAGEYPREAIEAIQSGWNSAYLDTLATAFSAVLARSVGASEVSAMPIGEVVLSTRLRQQSREVSALVRRKIQEHVKGWQDARRLALDIYEGYGFRASEPAAVMPRYVLPKYLRAAFGDDEALRDLMRHEYTGKTLRKLLDDPLTGRPLAEQYARIKVANIKTPTLKASYMQALDGLENGVGRTRLNRLLKTAYHEKQRYFANRIAQTELHRAWSDRQADEYMSTDRIKFVQWRMSVTHPEKDICDLHASVDRYGLGPGVYPKDLAPKPPAHPFCRCMLSPRIDIMPGTKWRENPAAHRVWLRKQGISEGSKVMGSRAKLAVALSQAPIDEVINIHRPKPYWVGRVGENVRMSDASIQSDLDSPMFTRFFYSEPGAVARFRVAELTDDERRIFGVKSSTLWLSRSSIDEHRSKHPEVDIDDYRKIPDIVHTGQVWQGPDARRFALLLIDGKPYRAAIKADEHGKEAWFLSLIFNTKQKPPKGAVRVR